MPDFEPVWLPEDRRPNGKISQTALRHFSGCPRSGYFYLLYKGEASTREMVRGTAIHAVLERANRMMVDSNEPTIPPELVKALVDEVLSEQHVPFEEHDYIRSSVWTWAEKAALIPQDVIAIETMVVMDVGGYEVRMRIDYADLRQDGTVAHIEDFKSSRSMPTQEEIARVRPDGTLTAKSMQLVLYALGLAYGVPVRIEDCGECGGSGLFMQDGPTMVVRAPCPTCDGKGTVEIREPFPLVGRAQTFELEYVYPGIEDKLEGGPQRRSMTLTRLELEEYRHSLGALIASLARAEETGDWPAIVSDAACGECPAKMLCPIPVELRDWRGTINTPEQAREAAIRYDRDQAEMRARGAELRAWLKAQGGELRFGNKVGEFVPTVTVRLDKDGLVNAAERAAMFGEPFRREDFEKVVNGTSYKVRDLTAGEIVARNGGGDGPADRDS